MFTKEQQGKIMWNIFGVYGFDVSDSDEADHQEHEKAQVLIYETKQSQDGTEKEHSGFKLQTLDDDIVSQQIPHTQTEKNIFTVLPRYVSVPKSDLSKFHLPPPLHPSLALPYSDSLGYGGGCSDSTKYYHEDKKQQPKKNPMPSKWAEMRVKDVDNFTHLLLNGRSRYGFLTEVQRIKVVELASKAAYQATSYNPFPLYLGNHVHWSIVLSFEKHRRDNEEGWCSTSAANSCPDDTTYCWASRWMQAVKDLQGQETFSISYDDSSHEIVDQQRKAIFKRRGRAHTSKGVMSGHVHIVQGRSKRMGVGNWLHCHETFKCLDMLLTNAPVKVGEPPEIGIHSDIIYMRPKQQASFQIVSPKSNKMDGTVLNHRLFGEMRH
jgi:hypothetical protein